MPSSSYPAAAASSNTTVGDLTTTDDALIGDDLIVTGLATIGETLAVTGTTTLAAANTAALLPIANNAHTLGSASFQWSDLRSVLATFSGAVVCNTTLGVTGNITGSADIFAASQLSVGETSASVAGAAVTWTGSNGHAVGYDVTTNSTDKHNRIGVYHYTNAAGVASVISGDVTSTANKVNIGGGYATWNAATHVYVYTAATSQVGAGTIRTTWGPTGLLTHSGAMTVGTTLGLGTYNDAGRPAAGTAGRVIFNTDDGQLNIDDGANWTLPDGTTT